MQPGPGPRAAAQPSHNTASNYIWLLHALTRDVVVVHHPLDRLGLEVVEDGLGLPREDLAHHHGSLVGPSGPPVCVCPFHCCSAVRSCGPQHQGLPAKPGSRLLRQGVRSAVQQASVGSRGRLCDCSRVCLQPQLALTGSQLLWAAYSPAPSAVQAAAAVHTCPVLLTADL